MVDRLIQQALLQVLQPLIDPGFSEHSHGFRPGRSAHGAVLKAQQYVQAGYQVVVDVDLEKFFDRVNHDILMDRLAKRIADKPSAAADSALSASGHRGARACSGRRHEGTPQGGPLSPLLANVLLDEVDRELERRGHRFVRYADDCNVYVKSLRAGRAGAEALRSCYAKLRLKVNEAKTAVAAVWGRKFLGYCLRRSPKGEVKLAMCRTGAWTRSGHDCGRSPGATGAAASSRSRATEGLCAGLEGVLPTGADADGLRELDSWLRHRLRAVQLKQWQTRPRDVPGAARVWVRPRPWRNRRGAQRRPLVAQQLHVNSCCPIAYYDRLGVPKFS